MLVTGGSDIGRATSRLSPGMRCRLMEALSPAEIGVLVTRLEVRFSRPTHQTHSGTNAEIVFRSRTKGLVTSIGANHFSIGIDPREVWASQQNPAARFEFAGNFHSAM